MNTLFFVVIPAVMFVVVYWFVRKEGLAYVSEQVPDEIMCSGETCFNSWDEMGVVDTYNT